jgi:pimeloyl-ACP methyl ester carboxylesterase
MSIAIVGDQLIHYEAIGRGEPLVFVHGWIGSWRYWWPSMQALSSRHRTFAFDLWGYGDSSKEEENYSFESYVEMMHHFIDKLGMIQPPTIVGHTLGAAVALRFATRHPEQVKRLIMVGLPVAGEYVPPALTSSDPETILARQLGKSQNFPEVEREIRKTDPEAPRRVAAEMRGITFAEDLSRCQVPSLLVFGEQDPLMRKPDGDYFHLTRPGEMRHYITLDTQHFPMLEQPAQFNRLLADFVHRNGDFSSIAPKEYWQRRVY